MKTLLTMWVIALSLSGYSIYWGSQHYSKYPMSQWKTPIQARSILSIRGAYQVDAMFAALLLSGWIGWLRIGFKGRSLVRLECAKKSRLFLDEIRLARIQIRPSPQEVEIWQRRNKRSA